MSRILTLLSFFGFQNIDAQSKALGFVFDVEAYLAMPKNIHLHLPENGLQVYATTTDTLVFGTLLCGNKTRTGTPQKPPFFKQRDKMTFIKSDGKPKVFSAKEFHQLIDNQFAIPFYAIENDQLKICLPNEDEVYISMASLHEKNFSIILFSGNFNVDNFKKLQHKNLTYHYFNRGCPDFFDSQKLYGFNIKCVGDIYDEELLQQNLLHINLLENVFGKAWFKMIINSLKVN